jgi:hypothetical protein
MFNGRLYMAKKLNDREDSSIFDPTGVGKELKLLQKTSEGATLVVSATDLTLQGSHFPVIDLDVPVNLVPATTLGHTHLYINHPVSPEGLMEILEVLSKHGIVEEGYYQASKKRGFSAVRLPWVKKDMNAL